jgi:hypothetical protein
VRVKNRFISILAVTAVVVVSLSACGSGASGETVVRVAGVGSISKATLEHWLPVEAVLLYQQYPTTPPPKGVVPDPPNYTNCIAYLRSHPSEAVTKLGPNPLPAQLKSQCSNRHHELKEIMLNTLILWKWTEGTGAELGMNVSDAEAKAQLKEVNPRFFSSDAAFKRYLKFTGQTLADALLRSKVQRYEVKLYAKLTEAAKRLPQGLTAQQREQALAKIASRFPPNKQWVAKTTCRSGYVVSACKQYKGSQPPGIPN